MASILAVFVALPAQADVTGSPRVIDGDTIWIGETKIRLYGIDAPEAKQLCHRDGICQSARSRPASVRCPRVRDRGAGEAGPRIRFTSAILPPYLRRARSIEELLPWLYLKGISTGDFSEALAALLGPEAPGLSASTIVRLKEVWQGEMAHWQGRDLSARRYVYFWADGIYFSPRLDHDKQCILVIIGADE